ncbi:hypothetical protein VP01_15623g1, partial [Puccinia sorghi]
EGLIQYLQRQVQESHTKSISTGFDLTNEDQKAGISTINEKVERMCPPYHVMNKLMGVQAFINPWFKVDSKADNETETSSSSASG